MLVIVYSTKTNPQKRTIWTLADKTFPNIEPSSIIELLSTSFETTYIQELSDTRNRDWLGIEAQNIFEKLKDKFFNIPR